MFRRTCRALADVLVVESPNKAKTIRKFLFGQWNGHVIATGGHVVELSDFDPVAMRGQFRFAERKKRSLDSIVKTAGKTGTVFLAMDPDREGELIAHDVGVWLEKHGCKSRFRISFQEVTKDAVLKALLRPGKVDSNLVDAGAARRLIDFWFGIGASRNLRRHHKDCHSAGRVQSPALALVADRTAQQESFKSDSFHVISVSFLFNGEKVVANLQRNGSVRIPKTAVEPLTKFLQTKPPFRLSSKVVQVQSPPPPFFDTATCLKECSKSLKMKVPHVTRALQILFEAGHITYIRTDSVTISPSAENEVRQYVMKTFGKQFLADGAGKKAKPGKHAQEAHEAIRPTCIQQEKLHDVFHDVQEVYNIIRKRTLEACMVQPAYRQVQVQLICSKDKNLVVKSASKYLLFEGALVLNGRQNKATPAFTPPAKAGEVTVDFVKVAQKETKPPPDLTAPDLIQELKKHGIGRPSTYSSILSTMVDKRDYLKCDEGNTLTITEGGRIAYGFVKDKFPRWVDYQYTSELEKSLDRIASGNLEKDEFLKSFREKFSEDLKNVSIGMKHLGTHKGLNVWLKYDYKKKAKVICLGELGTGPAVQVDSTPKLVDAIKLLKSAEVDTPSGVDFIC